MIIFWKNKKVAVVGLGVEGLSSAKYLHGFGAIITILDAKAGSEIDADILSEAKRLKFKFKLGKKYLEGLSQFDVIVRSPGVQRNLKELIEAEKNGVIITSQTKLFFEYSQCPIIGVTGTKGKGTTVTLIYEILKKSGKDVYLGGNIGKPPFDFLDKLNKHSIVVLELSSFQLQDIDKSPHIAVMLMTTSDHLDYHADTYEYINAKRNILKYQSANDFAILNRDYPATNESDIHTAGKTFYISRERVVGDGCFAENNAVWIHFDKRFGRLSRVANDARGSLVKNVNLNPPSLSERRLTNDYESYSTKIESAFNSFASGKAPSASVIDAMIIATQDIALAGKHNLENVCAAVMAGALAGANLENIRKVLRSFKGLPHRLELVKEVRGVKYYDDSFSTTPETAIAAIEAFNPSTSSLQQSSGQAGQDSQGRYLILILGGSSKKSDFTELGEVINKAKYIKAIIGIGEEWDKIRSKIKNQKSKILLVEEAKDMHMIVFAAEKIAKSGDVVLLSPGCASFGMFQNYKDRGEQFRMEVEKL